MIDSLGEAFPDQLVIRLSHRPVEPARLTRMYGLLLSCKQKTNDGSWSALMYSALGGVRDYGP
jgi:hypothetical protein